MSVVYYFFIFLIGSSFMSFFAVITHDRPSKNNLFRRSQCDTCKKSLKWYVIIPILGYVISRGRCLFCKNKVSPIYPLSELFGGLLLVIITLEKLDLIFYLPIIITLILLGFTDYYFGYVYPITYLFFVPSFVEAIVQHRLNIFFGFIVYLFLFLINYLYEGIGMGDVEIISILTMLLGIHFSLFIILLACLMCLITYFFKKQSSFRFVPYITIATIIVCLTPITNL